MVLLFCPVCATSLLLANLPGIAAAATAAVATKKALHLLPQRREAAERVEVADLRKPLARLEARKERRHGGQ